MQTSRIVAALAGGVGVLALSLPGAAPAADSNHDRIPDRWEVNHGLSLNVKQTFRDQDQDGLYNLAEFRSATDPRDVDSDNDGVSDEAEDRDGDGLTNGFEEETGTRQSAVDSDQDGVTDADEDLDGDGLDNLDEQGDETDPTDVDSDDDGVSDAYEDYDGDGIANVDDDDQGDLVVDGGDSQ